MSKIHAGLPNKGILEGKADSYNCIKVETCAVSGQLATDACRHDAMGYGTVTDYWAKGTQPTTYCQMHTTATVCAETGMLASNYCPNPVQQGVVTIPMDNPLYRWIGTQYQSVLEDYLGISASVSGAVCTYHNEFSRSSGVSAETARMISDAGLLLSGARNMLSSLNPDSGEYASLSGAVGYLEMVIGQEAPAQNDLETAMSVVQQAMTNAW